MAIGLKSLLFVTFTSVVVLSQNCISPRAWEASINYFDPVTDRGVRGFFSYDSINQRRFIWEERFDVLNDFSFTLFHVYALWRAPGGPTVYSFNVNTSQCVKSPITFPWRDYGPYPTATLRRTITYGTTTLPSAGVNVHQYWDAVNNSAGLISGVYESEFTLVGCVPVRHYFINISSQERDFREDHWYSTTLGIRNPDIFNLPRQCQNAVEVQNAITEDTKTWSMVQHHTEAPNAQVVSKPPEGANPIPCVSPPSWEAHSSFYDPITRLRIVQNVTQDSVNERQYFEEFRSSPLPGNGDDNFFKIYALWQTTPPTLYVYHVNTTVCVRANIVYAFRPIAVNPNATYVRTSVIGTYGYPDSGVEINTFAHRVNDARGNPSYLTISQVTAVGCIPVRFSYFNYTAPAPGQPHDYLERHWTNVVPKFADPNLFIPPAACRQAIESSVPAPADHTQWHKLYELHKMNMLN